jgi:hypothetical protein
MGLAKSVLFSRSKVVQQCDTINLTAKSSARAGALYKNRQSGRMAKLVDALGLGSSEATRAGSSPAPTINNASARSGSAIPLQLQLEAEKVAVERLIAATPTENVLDLASARARLAKIESDLSALSLPPSSRGQ